MFGYIQPLRRELKIREMELYRSVYCGLCHALSKRYGAFARLLVNYDLVLLCMLFWRGRCEFQKKRCMRHPLKKQCLCGGDQAMETAADALMLFSDWKLRDTAADEKGFRGIAVRLIRFSYRKAFREAARRLPGAAAQCAQSMDELWRIEKGLDADPASAFGTMLASVGEYCEDSRAARSLFYHLGRWIYMADAVEDLERDKRKNTYNPVAAMLLEGKDQKTVLDDLRQTLFLEQEALLAAYDLMPENRFTEITRNILTLGLHARGVELFCAKKCGKRRG